MHIVTRFFFLVVVLIILRSVPACAIGPIEVHNSDSSAALRLQMAIQWQTVWTSEDMGAGAKRSETKSCRCRVPLTPSSGFTCASALLSFKVVPLSYGHG